MASPSEVKAALYEALANSRGSTPDAVRLEVGAGGEIDSLEGVELVAAMEEQFDVRISDRELTSTICRFIPRLAQLVAEKTNATAGTRT